MNKRIIILAGIVVVLVLTIILVVRGRMKNTSPNITVNAVADPGAKELYKQAVRLKDDHKMLDAQKLYKEVLINYPDMENIDKVQLESETLNLNILFSNVAVPDKTVIHEVVVGDSLGKIAKNYGTTVEFIKRSNNIKGDVIRVGQKLRIWTGKFNVFVDKSQNRLVLKDGNEMIKSYSVSTGESNSTPVGEFTITTKLVDPVWFNRGVIVPPESPENVLGTRWLGFDLPAYGIHGTIEPETIGKQVTAGCVRMSNEDVEELYSILPIGTKVLIVD